MLKFRTLRADEIDCRVQAVTEKGCSILLYKDARVDQNILDETVGPERWQRKHELINENLFCSVGILCKREDDLYEWVWKQDVGTESYTEKEKGQASDSFKRACFNWGIGRELYTAPFTFIHAGNVKLEQKNGKWTTYDRFTVGQIEYTEGKISFLTIQDRNGKKVFSYGKPGGKDEQPEGTMMVGPIPADYIFKHSKETISKEAAQALADEAKKNGVDPAKIPTGYGIKAIDELTYTQYYTLMSGKAWDYYRNKS